MKNNHEKPNEPRPLKVRKPRRKSVTAKARQWIDSQNQISHIIKVDGVTRICLLDGDICLVDDLMKDLLPWLDKIDFCKPNAGIIMHFAAVTHTQPVEKELKVWLGDDFTFMVKNSRVDEFMRKYSMYKYIRHIPPESAK